jgi:hypothetical protein
MNVKKLESSAANGWPMKIEGPRPATASGSSRRAQGAGAGGFSLPADEAKSIAATAPSAGVTGVDALLALQGEEPAKERRARQAKRGRAALGALDELTLGLLSGAPAGRLRAELERLRAEAESTGEPQLDEVLREIDIRLAVEAAKLEQVA